MSKQTVFQIDWLSDPSFSSWLTQVPLDNKVARCKLCMKTFNLSNMGRRAVSSHMLGEKHKKNALASEKSASIRCFMNTKQPCNAEKEVASCSDSNIPEPERESQQRGLKSFLLSDSVAAAEIKWAVESVITHSSLRTAARDVVVMKSMFPDSPIAQKMQLQRDKIGYLLAYGIAPFFEKELLDKVMKCDFIVIGFDESLNKVAQKQQMDLNVRFWDDSKSEIHTRYLTSIFLGRSRAIDLLDAFQNKLSANLNFGKVLQISMDGPNVNIKFLREFKELLSASADPTDGIIMDMGSCGLHTL